jgi:tripartite-type tricarboxylate transporter receptor subunit TctC
MRDAEHWGLSRYLVGFACLWGTVAIAQSYPVKPIRLVVGFAPGGSTDMSARVLAQQLAGNLGQPVLVENRPGAGTAIANQQVAKAAPDGYTILSMTASGAGLPAVRKDLGYDLDRDFAAISRVATTTYVLMVHPSLPVRNVQDLIALARKRPGQLTHASEGVGASAHLAAELFKSMTKTDMLHVPFKGGAESSAATASGQVAMAFPTLTAALPLYTAGRIKILAVTAAHRSALKPDIPTLAEAGLPGYDRSSWNGIVAPAAVSKDIVARLHAAILKSVASPEMKEGLRKLGLEPIVSTPEEFAAFMRNEVTQNMKLIQAIGLKPS